MAVNKLTCSLTVLIAQEVVVIVVQSTADSALYLIPDETVYPLIFSSFNWKMEDHLLLPLPTLQVRWSQHSGPSPPAAHSFHFVVNSSCELDAFALFLLRPTSQLAIDLRVN